MFRADLSKTIEQIKDFLSNESDTFGGLVFFLLVELFLLNFVVVNVMESLKPYFITVLGFLFIVTVIGWTFHRHVKIPKTKMSIALANFKIISLDIKEGIAGEEKLTLEKEILEYIQDSLREQKNKLAFDRYINIINLPQRFQISEENVNKYSKQIKASILVWGTVKYASKNEVYLEPRFEFYAHPQGSFYKKIRERLLSKQRYRIDLSAELTSKTDSELTQLFHYLTYLAVTFEGIRDMKTKHHEEADKIFKSALENLSRIKNPSHALYDIHLLSKFYEGKNLHLWGKQLLKAGNKDEALIKYDQAAKDFFEKIDGPKKKGPKEKTFLEDFYFYGVHLLIKEGKMDQARKKLEQVKKKYQSNPLLLKEEIELQGKKNSKKAKILIKRADKQIVKGKEKVYQQIGDFFYGNKDYGTAKQYYEKKLSLDKKQLYNPALLDVDDHVKLMEIHLKNSELIKAQKEALTIAVNEAKNMMVKTLD